MATMPTRAGVFQDRRAPGLNPPFTRQSKERAISQSENNLGLDQFNICHKPIKTIQDTTLNETITKSLMLGCNFAFLS